MTCPGRYIYVNKNTMKMYSLKGVSYDEWNICDWCVTNGCADSYIDKVEEFVDHKNRRFSCNCHNVHATVNEYMCDECMEKPCGPYSLRSKWSADKSVDSGICLRCKSGISRGKYCSLCAHSELRCICGNPHQMASIGLVDLLYISQYFHVGHCVAYIKVVSVNPDRKYKVISRKARMTYPLKMTFDKFVARKGESKAVLDIIAEMAKNNTENDSCRLGIVLDDSSDSDERKSQLKLMKVPFIDSGRAASIIAKMCSVNIMYISLLHTFTEQEVLAADSSICAALDNDDVVNNIHCGVFSGNLTCSSLRKYLSRLHDLGASEKFYSAIRTLFCETKHAKKLMPQLRPSFAIEVVAKCCTDSDKKFIKKICRILGVKNMEEALNVALNNAIRNPKTAVRIVNNIAQMIPGFKWTVEHFHQSIESESSYVFSLVSRSVDLNLHKRALFERVIAKRGQKTDENNSLRTIARTIIHSSLEKFLAGTMDDDFAYFVAGYGKMFGNTLYELIESFANCKITYESALELIKLGYVPKNETINSLSEQFSRAWGNNGVNWNVVQMLRAARSAFRCNLYDEWDDLFEKRLEQFLETHDIHSRGPTEKVYHRGYVLDKIAQPFLSSSVKPYVITKWDECFYDEEYLYIANKLRMFVKHHYGIRNSSSSSSSEDETSSYSSSSSGSEDETSSSSSSSSVPMRTRRSDSTSSSSSSSSD